MQLTCFYKNLSFADGEISLVIGYDDILANMELVTFIIHQARSRELINLLADRIKGIVFWARAHLNLYIPALILAAIVCSKCELDH